MADTLSLDQLEALHQPAPSTPPPDPKTLSLQDLEAQHAPPKTLSLDELESHVKTQKIASDVQDAFSPGKGLPTREQIYQSPVGKAMDVLNKPSQLVAGGVARVIPGATEQLNPNKNLFPDLAYHDIVNYLAPKGEAVVDKLTSMGLGPDVSAAIAAAYQSAKTGIGMVADFALDPLIYTKFGGLTKAAEEARMAGKTVEVTNDTLKSGKAGQYVDNSRNLVEFQLPFTKKPQIEIAAQPVVDAAKNSIDLISRKVPGGDKAVEAGKYAADTAKRLIDYFDYRTNVPEVDLAASKHAGLKRGDFAYIDENFFKPLAARGFSDSENQVLSRAIESTKNAATKEDVFSAAQNAATELKLNIPPERLDEIADAGLKIKEENAKDLVERHNSGLINAGGIPKKEISFSRTPERSTLYPTPTGTVVYHGTKKSFDAYDFDKSGGLQHFAKEPGFASQYASGAGGGRGNTAIKDQWLIDRDSNVVYELKNEVIQSNHIVDGDFVPVGKISDNGGLVTKENLIPLSADEIHEFKPINYDEFKSNNVSDSGELSGSFDLQPKSARLIPQDISGKNILDLKSPAGVSVLAKLDRNQAGRLSYLIDLAKEADKTKDYYQLNGNIWTATKYAKTKGGFHGIIDQLKELGYDGIHFRDDFHDTIALFGGKKLPISQQPNSELAALTIENYLVHKISPEAKNWIAKNKNPELAASIEEASLANQVGKAMKGSYVSSFDTGKYQRTLRSTLDEANAIMKEKTGVTQWFITDPVVATAMKRAETRKLVRDKELLDVASKYAVVPETVGKANALRKEGYKTIEHPELNARGYTISGQNLNTAMYPAQIADKLGYYLTPRSVGQFPAFVDAYNRVFRRFALAKPDYYIQNWGENLMKNYVQGVKLEDYVDAQKVLSGSKDTIQVGNKIVPAQKLLDQIKALGIQTGGQFQEGLENILFTGKKLAQEKSLAGKVVEAPGKLASSVIHGLRDFGERGENFTRAALFLNRLKKGYSPETAAFEVERWLFDFSRNSRATNEARRYIDPFIQAAIKTAHITPELIGTKPGAYNFVQNNLLRALESSFNDPASVQDVMSILPGYKQLQDPYLGPILPGNHWLVASSAPQQYAPTGGKAAVLFKLPIGPDILNRFMLFDSNVLRNNQSVSSPLIRSIGILATGRDPFSGQEIDLVKNTPQFSKRLQAALVEAGSAIAPFPNTTKFLKQKLKIGDPQYFTPDSLLALNGAFGKFVNVVPLDKEFVFRQLNFMSIRKELVSKLVSSLSAEARGTSSDAIFQDKPGGEFLSSIINTANRKYHTSAEVFAELTGQTAQAQLRSGSMQHLAGEISTSDLVGLIKDLDKTIRDSNESYVTLRRQLIRSFKGAREQDLPEVEEKARQQLLQ